MPKLIGARALTPAEKQARYRGRKKAGGLKRQESWKRPEYMTAAAVAWKDLADYCRKKTEAWNDDEIWKLYQHLLKQAKAYRQDSSGYRSIELQKDEKRALEMNKDR
jgi:Leu/Phe-tRNA-protein transferase